jgi:hypothetical protein
VKRPSGHSRARWFAQRRIRRGGVVPMTLTQFDARIGKLVMRVVRKANSPAGWFRVFDNKAAP